MENLKTADLLTRYNEMATDLNLPTVKRFQDRKTAERRYAEMVAKFEEANKETPVEVTEVEGETEVVTEPKKVRKAASLDEGKTVPVVVAMLESLKGTCSQAEAFRTTLVEFPKVTRVQFKHSAIAAGYPGLSARNAFDRFNKAK